MTSAGLEQLVYRGFYLIVTSGILLDQRLHSKKGGKEAEATDEAHAGIEEVAQLGTLDNPITSSVANDARANLQRTGLYGQRPEFVDNFCATTKGCPDSLASSLSRHRPRKFYL